MVEAGEKAPDFSLKDAGGRTVKLSDFKGKKLVLYFYPKDDTPGCTKEACSFRDDFSKYKKAGIEILGVSLDDEQSHKKFAGKYDLPFTLLADTGKEVSRKYGVLGEKSFFGKKLFGVKRTTFLIDESGKIRQIFRDVKVEGHSKEILEKFG